MKALPRRAGGFTLITSGNLAVGPNAGIVAFLTVPNGQTVTLGTDHLVVQAGNNSITTPTPTISAVGGTVIIQPYTAGTAITLTSAATPPTTGLSLTNAEAKLISASTLQLGQSTAVAGGVPVGNVVFGQTGDTTIDLMANGGFATLALQTSGTVSQNAPLTVNALSGTSAGGITLSNPSNLIPSIGNLDGDAGPLSLATSGNLSVSGSVTSSMGVTLAAGGSLTVPVGSQVNGLNVALTAASPASPSVDATAALTIAGGIQAGSSLSLSSGSNGIGLSGTVSTGTLTVATTGALTQTGGSVTATDLSGAAASVSLTSGTNAISGVGSQSASFTSGTGDFTLQTGSANLTVGASPNGGIAVPTGRNITLAAAGLTINPVQNAPTLDASGGIITLAANALTFNGLGQTAAISAPGGTLAITPFNPATTTLLTNTAPSSPGGLVITTAMLANTTEATLQIGAPVGASGLPTGAVTVDATTGQIDLGSAGYNNTGPSTLAFKTAGDITQAMTGALGVTNLSGQSGTLALPGTGNQISTLAGYMTTGDLAFHTNSTLLVSADVTANAGLGNVTLSSSGGSGGTAGMTLLGNISGATVSLNSLNGVSPSTSGGIAQDGGIIAAGTLTGAGGFATLTQNNQVANLGDFATYGALSFTDTIPATVTGAVSSSALVLAADGVTEAMTGSIMTGALSGSSSGPTILDNRNNQISGIDSFNQTRNQTGGDLTVVTSTGLTFFPSGSGTVTVANGSLTIVADTVGIGSGSGSITAPNGSVGFAPFTANRRIELIDTSAADPQSLSIASSLYRQIGAIRLEVGDASTSGTINIGNPNETIDLTNRVATLQVRTTGPVTQGVGPSPGGGIAALYVGNLTGSANTVTLASATNQIGQIGVGDGIAGEVDGLQATPSITVQSAINLLLANAITADPTNGSVTIGTAGSLTVLASNLSAQTVNLTASGGTLTQTFGSISAGGTLSLTSQGLTSQTGGVITAGTLTGTTGSLTLGELGNAIQAVSGASSGAVTLTTSTGLTIGAQFGNTTLNVLGGDLSFAGYSSYGDLGVYVTAGSVTTQTDASLRAGTLSGSATSVNLTGVNIDTLGSFAATGAYSVNDVQSLTAAGTIAAATIAISTSPAMGEGGPIPSPITQSGGSLTAGTISIQSNDSFTQNAGSIAATGALNISANGPLAAGGTLSGSTVNLVATNGNSLGTISQAGGTITAGTLSGSSDDATSLTSAGNMVATLAGFTAAGPFALTDGQALTVTGPVSAGPLSLAVTGNLALNGSVTGSAVSLVSSAAISEGPGGQLTAATLTGSATTANLGGTNAVGTLGGFATTAGFLLTDGQALTVAGPVTDGQSITLSATGNLGLTGTVTAPVVALASLAGPSMSGGIYQTSGTVTAPTLLTLTSPGVIGQTGGTIVAGTLSGSSAGVTSLASAGNAVGTLSGFSSAGGFSLADGVSLAVTGTLTDSTGVTLATPGSLSLGGTVTTGALSLTTGGAITQPGGSVVAASLSGSGGSLALGQRSNQVGALGGFTSAGDFALTDGTAVTVAGAVSAGQGRTLTLVDDAPSFGTGGSLSAPGGIVALAEYTAGNGITLGGGGGLGGTPAVTAGTLTVGLPSGGPITVAGAFNLSAVPVLDLESAGAISETGAGAIRVGTLTGHGASAALGGANQVATLGGFTTPGGFALTDTQSLAASSLNAGSATLSVGGDLSFAGSNTVGGGLALTVGGAVSEDPATVLRAASLSGTAASVALNAGGNTVGSLAGFATTGAFALTDGEALTVTGPVSAGPLSLAVTGNLALNGSVTGSAVSLVSSAAISEGPGGQLTAATLTGSATTANLGGTNAVGTLGGFATNAGFLLTDGQALTVAGPVTDGQSITLSATGNLGLTGTVTAPVVALASLAGPSMSGGIYQTSGTVTAPTLLTLTSPGVIGQTGGTIVAGTLSGSSAGVTSLASAGNAVGTLSGFSSAGGFSLADGVSLAVTGTLTDSTGVTLATPGSLSLGGTVTTGALSLTTGGAITQPGGSVVAASLAGSGGSLALSQRANQVGTLGGFTSAGDFALTDGTAVTVAGAVSAGSGRTLTLVDDAPSFGTGGSLSAPGGIVALAEYTAGNGITLGGGGGLGGTPAVMANTLTVGSPSGGPITVAGAFNLSAVPVLDLESAGAISETGAGALRVGTLTGHGASAALGGANQVATLGGFTTPGGFALTDTQSLAASSLNAGSATLSVGGDLSFAGSNTIGGGLALTVGGAVSEDPATLLRAASLSGTAASVALNAGGNMIAMLAGFTAAGPFALTDGQALTVTGPVSAGPLSLAVTGNLALNGSVTGSAVSLVSSAAISEGPGGQLTAATLTGSATTANMGGTNAVGTLGGFATTAGLVLTDGQALTVAGPVTDGQSITLSATGNLGLTGTVTAPVVALASLAGPSMSGGIYQTSGTVTAPTLLTLTSPGVIGQTGGTIVAGTLSGSSAGVTSLASTGNAVGTLSGFGSAGGFSLADGVSLAVTGTLTDSTGVTLATPGSLSLGGTVTTGALSLTTGGAITQPGGSVVAASLAGSGGSLALSQRANQVGTLGGFTSAGDFALTDGTAVTVAGAVSAGSGRTLTLVDDAPSFGTGGSLSAPGGIVALAEYTAGNGITLGGGGGLGGTPAVMANTLTVGSPSGGPITVAGAFNLSAVPVLDLESAGAISETGAGALRVGTLTGHGASAALGGANQVATLGGFTTPGGFALTDTQSLAASSLNAGSATLSVGGDLSFAGSNTIGGGLALTVGGAVSEDPATLLRAASLSGTAASVALNAGGNMIAMLAGFTAAGPFALTDGQALTVTGPVSAGPLSLAVTGNLALNGSVTGSAVSLVSSAAISEGPGGQLTAATLTGSATTANMGGTNAVGTLGGFATTAGLVLTDGQALTVAGPVTDGQSITLSATGNLGLTGTVTAPVVALASLAGPSMSGGIYQTSGTVTALTLLTLTSPGVIGQTGGTIVAGTLSGSSAGVTSLASAGNAVGTLSGFSSSGGFQFTDQSALQVTGPVTDGASVGLSAAGALTLNGTVQTAALSLASGGAITQPGGSLVASTLSGSAQNAALGQRGNQVTTLNGFASKGDFSLTDSVPLTVAGAVSAGPGRTLTLVNDAPGFGAGGSLSAPGGTVALAEYTPGQGITVAGGGSLTGTPPVTAATLTVGAATGGPITVAGPFNLSAVSVLDLESAGAIRETGAGAIRVGTLTGSGASATLGGGNQIGSVGRFTTAGAFTLTDTAGLAVSGPLTASAVSLVAAGDLALSGPIVAPNSVSLVAGGAITQTGGGITTGSLSGSAASASLGSAGNAVATLAGFTTSGDFTLFDSQSLTVSAPVDPTTITLSTLGSLTLNSSVTGDTVVLNAGGPIIGGPGGQVIATTLTGSANTVALNGINQVGTLGDFQATGGFSLIDSQPLAITGTVTAGQPATISSAGNLGLSGSITAPVVSLTANNGGITQSAGAITASSAAVLNAAGAITQNGGSILVGSPGTPGALTLTAGGPVTEAGTITTSNLAISASGAVIQTGGALTVAGLSATAGGPISLGVAGRAVVGGVGNLASPASITLVDSGPLLLLGTVAAPNVAVIATGNLTLLGGTIQTNGLPVSQQLAATPSLPGSYFQVVPGTDGTSTINQIGLTTILPYSGTMSAVRFDLAGSGGTVTLSALDAGSTNLVLSLGSGSGSGTIDAANLTVLGSGGSAAFGGQVSGRTDVEAAQVSQIFPAVSSVYTLNGCAIAAQSCSQQGSLATTITAAQAAASSVIRPDILTLDVLDLSVTRDRDDPTLLLPNISDRDY